MLCRFSAYFVHIHLLKTFFVKIETEARALNMSATALPRAYYPLNIGRDAVGPSECDTRPSKSEVATSDRETQTPHPNVRP